MKSKLLIATLLTAAMSTALADTYVVASDERGSSDVPKLVQAHDASKCVYGDKAVKLGDTLIVEGTTTVMVCASGPQGAVFYLLSQEPAQRVISSAANQTK